MGKVADVSVGIHQNATCNQCGMDNEGCCHDEPQFIKLSVEHQASFTTIFLPQFVIQTPVAFFHDIVNYYNPNKAVRQILKKPLISSSRNIFYCVFRIWCISSFKFPFT